MFNKLFVVLCTSLVLCSSFAATADVTNTNADYTIPAAEVKIYNSIIGDYIVGIRPARDFYGTKNQLRAAQESLNDIKALRLYEGFTRAEQALETFEAKHRGRYNYSREGAKQTNAERKKLNDNLDEMKYFAQDRLLRIIDSDSRNRKKADDAAAKKKAEAAAAAKKIEDARLDKIAADKVIEDARLAKIAADKVLEDARLAKIAADKEKEEKRLAKIAAAEKIKALVAAGKLRREKENAAFAAQRALAYKKRAENYKMAQDLAADKARRLREYEKNKAKNVASIALSLLDEFNKGPKDPNIIKSITKDGIVRTLYCNPGPCTPGSVILHGNISGVDMGVPVNGFAKQLKVHMADKKPGANFTVGDHLELIDPLRVFNDVEIINESAAKFYDSIDINLIRALSIPKGQVEKNKQAHTKLIESSHDNDVNPLQHGCWWC